MAETENLTVEQDIAQLEKQLQEKRAVLDTKGKESKESMYEREIVRQHIGDRIQQHIPQYVPQQKQTKPNDEKSSYDEPGLKEKVEQLINLVFSKNLEEGIKEVAKTDNFALIDAFHDIITDQFYEKMLASGKIKKID